MGPQPSIVLLAREGVRSECLTPKRATERHGSMTHGSVSLQEYFFRDPTSERDYLHVVYVGLWRVERVSGQLTMPDIPVSLHMSPFTLFELAHYFISYKSISKSSPSQIAIFIFLAKIKKPSPTVSIPGCHLCQVWKKSTRARIYACSYPRRIRPYQKRWKGVKIILFLSQSS